MLSVQASDGGAAYQVGAVEMVKSGKIWDVY